MRLTKLTKRPKTVLVKHTKVESYQSEYTCPSCYGIFVGYVNRNTTRFLCKCGQELIVNKGE